MHYTFQFPTESGIRLFEIPSDYLKKGVIWDTMSLGQGQIKIVSCEDQPNCCSPTFTDDTAVLLVYELARDGEGEYPEERVREAQRALLDVIITSFLPQYLERIAEEGGASVVLEKASQLIERVAS